METTRRSLQQLKHAQQVQVAEWRVRLAQHQREVVVLEGDLAVATARLAQHAACTIVVTTVRTRRLLGLTKTLYVSKPSKANTNCTTTTFACPRRPWPKRNPACVMANGMACGGRRARNPPRRRRSSTSLRAKQGLSAARKPRMNGRLTVSVDRPGCSELITGLSVPILSLPMVTAWRHGPVCRLVDHVQAAQGLGAGGSH